MTRSAQTSKEERNPNIDSVLRDLDKKISTSCPDTIGAGAAGSLLEIQSKRIATTLETNRTGAIESLVHAVFHDFSNSPSDREAAKRWFSEHRSETKRVRYVFDRYDGLARLNRLKEVGTGSIDAPPADAAFPDLPEENKGRLPLHLDPEGLRFLFTLPDIHGNYSPEIVALVKRKRQDRTYIFLAFPPKCGGTYLRDALGRISGAGPAPMRPGHALGGRDVSPYLPMMAAQMMSVTGQRAYMTHAHMIGYNSNIAQLNLFGIKPVVMKRSIADMLCSYSDMLTTEGRDKNGGYNWSLLCGIHTDESFLDLDPEQRADFLVYHQAPWYIQFYASWLHASRSQSIPVHWVAFEEFRSDPAATIAAILEFYGMAEKAKYIPAALARAEANKAALRFNKGVSGRGAKFLKPHHLVHLHRLAAGYPDIDFVAEGLLPPLSEENAVKGDDLAFLANARPALRRKTLHS